MFKNIKSTYFIKILFSYLDEKQKLKILKCSKSLQKDININIINYKHLARKYLIYESNGIGKEYDGYDNALLFIGEYINGQKNGMVKDMIYLVI